MPYLLERAPSSNRFLDPWLKSLVNYWARKTVSFKSQDRGFNSLADGLRRKGSTEFYLCTIALALLVYVNFNIWLSGPAKFPGLWRNGPLFCRYPNYLDAKMTIFQSLEKYFPFCILNVTRHVN